MSRLALAIVALTLMMPGGAAATELGVSDDGVTRNLIGPGRDAAALQALGAGLHRFTFNWRFAEPRPGDYRFGVYDTIYAADLRRGIRPVFVVLFAPDWSWDPGVTCPRERTCPFPPARAHLNAWRALIAKLVTRYPRMAALEVWNEPNLDAFWAPKPDPGRYVELVRAAHDAVRGAGSAVPVLAGSLSDAPSAAGVAGVDAAPFLAAMYRSGAAGAFDGVSVHPYPLGLDLSPTLRTLALVDRVRATFGDRSPLWVTEIGASTVRQLSEAQQSAVLVELLRILARRPDVPAVFIHTLVAQPSGPANPESGYGLLRADLQPKPAYCAIAAERLRFVLGCGGPSPVTAPDPVLQARWAAQEAIQRHVGAALGLPAPAPPRAEPRVVLRRSGAARLFCARADRSYCAALGPGVLRYGQALGSIDSAVVATLSGSRLGW